jgi:uncharacterized protein YecE (DUF72 family)
MRWDDASVEGRLFLGTSGFAYEEWRHGVFYPEGVTASRMLRHYSSVFGSVEINYTFRKWPSEKVLDAWREQTPDGFRFAVKANQRITHTRRLAGAGADLREFAMQARRLGDRLGPVLVQLPPNLLYDAELLRAFADDLPDGILTAMEFRHESWAEARPVLDQRGIALCVADTDEAPATEEQLSWEPFGYLRLRRADYGDDELAVWARRIGATLQKGRDVHCYFKHEDSAAGPRMAMRLRELLDQPSEDVLSR